MQIKMVLRDFPEIKLQSTFEFKCFGLDFVIKYKKVRKTIGKMSCKLREILFKFD